MLNNIGLAWNALGDSKKAIEYCKQAYDIFKELLGDEHPYTRTVKQGLDVLRGTRLKRTWLDWLRRKWRREK